MSKSDWVNNPVVKRELIREGIISLVKVPKKIELISQKKGRKHEMFGNGVIGGWLTSNIFNREKCLALPNELIIVEVKILRGTHKDGKKFIYMDLYPTGEVVGFERRIFQHRKTEPSLPKGTLTFYCIEPVMGMVAFVPLSS